MRMRMLASPSAEDPSHQRRGVLIIYLHLWSCEGWRRDWRKFKREIKGATGKKGREEGESGRMKGLFQRSYRGVGWGVRACHLRGEEDGRSPPAAPLLRLTNDLPAEPHAAVTSF